MAQRTKAQRSASAKKAARTRKRNAAAKKSKRSAAARKRKGSRSKKRKRQNLISFFKEMKKFALEFKDEEFTDVQQAKFHDDLSHCLS